MSELISILVPVYNRADIIAETIFSALNQSYENIEVIVVDNSSTDNTWAVIQSIASQDKRLKAFRNKSNIGPVRNWLRCVDEASGVYGKILWSDDLISADFLEKCLPLLDEETAFVYSGVKIFTDKPENGDSYYFIGTTGHFSTSYYIKKALIGNNVPVSPGCALFRMVDIKSNLHLHVENKIGSDFSMHAIGNDLLLFLLTAKDYSKFGFVAEPLSFFRAHEGSISISSSDGKLPLHYMLVRALYAERYQYDLLSQVVANVWLFLIIYPHHKLFGIQDVNDFFHEEVRVNYFYVVLKLFRYAIRLPLHIFRKTYRKLVIKK